MYLDVSGNSMWCGAHSISENMLAELVQETELTWLQEPGRGDVKVGRDTGVPGLLVLNPPQRQQAHLKRFLTKSAGRDASSSHSLTMVLKGV